MRTKRVVKWLNWGTMLAFSLILIWLLFTEFRTIDFAEVARVLAQIPTKTLMLSLFLTGLGYTVCFLYEWLGSYYYLRKNVPAAKVLRASFIGYSFNYNLGSLVGAVGMRIKLYRALAFGLDDIAKLTAFCAFSSWVGYFLVLAATMVTPLGVPHHHSLKILDSFALGIAILAAITLILVVVVQGKVIKFFRWLIRPPSLPIFITQLIVSSLQWLLVASIIYVLFRVYADVRYIAVLRTYLFAAIVGWAAHIPAGFGVLEGAFLLTFSDTMSNEKILGVILGFRLVYYLTPLLLSLLLYGHMEWQRFQLWWQRRSE